MATTLTSTGITFPNGTTQTTAAGPAGSTITTNTYDATSTSSPGVTMNNNGLNFFPRLICSACGPNSRPMQFRSGVGQGWGTCGDGPINYPSENYQGIVTADSGSYGQVRCRSNYKYITYS